MEKGSPARVSKRLRRPSGFVLVTLASSLVLDISGMAFGLFYEGFFWDNLAHFLTSFALVALAAEIAQSRGALPLVVPGRRALVAGAIVGLVGGGAWEIVELVANFFFPALIYNPPADTAMDMVFGVFGGALGAWRTAAYLHRKPKRG